MRLADNLPFSVYTKMFKPFLHLCVLVLKLGPAWLRRSDFRTEFPRPLCHGRKLPPLRILDKKTLLFVGFRAAFRCEQRLLFAAEILFGFPLDSLYLSCGLLRRGQVRIGLNEVCATAHRGGGQLPHPGLCRQPTSGQQFPRLTCAFLQAVRLLHRRGQFIRQLPHPARSPQARKPDTAFLRSQVISTLISDMPGGQGSHAEIFGSCRQLGQFALDSVNLGVR